MFDLVTVNEPSEFRVIEDLLYQTSIPRIRVLTVACNVTYIVDYLSSVIKPIPRFMKIYMRHNYPKQACLTTISLTLQLLSRFDAFISIKTHLV